MWFQSRFSGGGDGIGGGGGGDTFLPLVCTILSLKPASYH